MKNKINILICQLGSPKAATPKALRSYLKEFLSDPRVIDTPRLLWFFILNLFILPFRSKSSAKAYKRIEFCGFFPLMELTKSFAKGIGKRLGANFAVKDCYLLSEPRLKDLVQTDEKVFVFPQFPQFSDTTTSSVIDQINEYAPGAIEDGRVVVAKNFHNLKGFIDQSVNQINGHILKYPIEELVISFHGIPKRYVMEKGDIYYKHCCETFSLIKDLVDFPEAKVHMTFQSRLGSEEWLDPYTDQFCEDLVKSKNVKSIGVYCPSFVVDCLETTDEIGAELGTEIEELGGEIVFIPCLNLNGAWLDAYSEYAKAFCLNDQEKLKEITYEIPASRKEEIVPELKLKSEPLSPKAKSTIKIVFLTLFLDLVGFSIIFPMFPALAKHYLEIDPDNFFLKIIFGSIESFTQMGGVNMSSIVLFGGALGALYSLLQFLAAPLWGGLSDRYGRKPILIISIFGLFLSYALWVFAGSFTLLIFARFIGGIMGGNISTASAAIADVTTEKNRSKGMAFVGIAFALGFIIGPALGGLLTAINPLDHFPELAAYGVNPFSYPALLAAILSLFNIYYLIVKFKETLSPENKSESVRSINVFKILSPLPESYKNVNFTNYSYFLFISAFSGMEFTLTFLAVERLGYSSLDNAYMFIFIGFIIALVQGGYIRRKAHLVGEKKVAMRGLMAIIPGLVLIAFTPNSFLLYLGLFFLALGSAMAIPTLTSLVSLNTPANEQGRILGVFRSLGALGRIIGPILASISYWKMGSAFPYIAGALFIIFPILILKNVEETSQDNETINS